MVLVYEAIREEIMTRDKFLELIGFIGSFASIVSLFFLEEKWCIAKSIMFVLLLMLFFISTYSLFFRRDTLLCKTEEEINSFMKKWINTNGVVKILSRDLTWVDKKILKILSKKGKDLYLYVEKENDKTREILQENPECNIFYYGNIGFVPKSRFTIIHANKDEKQIAIAIKEKAGYKKLEHEIYISKDRQMDKKIVGLADDLIQCINCRRKSDGEYI